MHTDALLDSNCELVQTVPVASLDLSVDVKVSVGSKLFRCGQWKGKSVVVCRIRWSRSRIVVVSVVVPVTVGSSVVDVP